MPNKWPFQSWLILAVRGYGLTPNAFWQMSLQDWLTLTQRAPNIGVSRKSLTALMLQFPDEKRDDDPNK